MKIHFIFLIRKISPYFPFVTAVWCDSHVIRNTAAIVQSGLWWNSSQWRGKESAYQDHRLSLKQPRSYRRLLASAGYLFRCGVEIWFVSAKIQGGSTGGYQNLACCSNSTWNVFSFAAPWNVDVWESWVPFIVATRKCSLVVHPELPAQNFTRDFSVLWPRALEAEEFLL